jgi:hypothetical protein
MSPFPVDESSRSPTDRCKKPKTEKTFWRRPCQGTAGSWRVAGAAAEIAAGADDCRHGVDRWRLSRLPADPRFLDAAARLRHPVAGQRRGTPLAAAGVGLVGPEAAAGGMTSVSARAVETGGLSIVR